MRNIIRTLFGSSIGRIIIFPVKTVYGYSLNHLIPEKASIKIQYKTFVGHKLDLENPLTFTEKIQWLKLYDRNPLYTICADKYRVRDYITNKIGNDYLIPLLFVTDDPKNIPFEELPSEYIIKTNHTSGYNMMIKNDRVVHLDKSHEFNKQYIINTLKQWLKVNMFYISREWEYKDIKPMLLIETLLSDESGNDILNDYKIHCFKGKALYIQTIFDRLSKVKENWYDLGWNLLDVYYFSDEKKSIAKPKNLRELINIAEKLAEDFHYVRVDLYSVNNRILFGELTFHPHSGLMKFRPKEWDIKLGNELTLPNSAHSIQKYAEV